MRIINLDNPQDLADFLTDSTNEPSEPVNGPKVVAGFDVTLPLAKAKAYVDRITDVRAQGQPIASGDAKAEKLMQQFIDDPLFLVVILMFFGAISIETEGQFFDDVELQTALTGLSYLGR